MAKPHSYTPEIGAEILRRMAGGEFIKRICEDEHMPSRATVYEWIASIDDERLADFLKLLPRARYAHALALSDDVVDIADDGSNDWMERETEKGNIVTVLNHEHIQRSKLRVDVREKRMKYIAPNQFGDQLAITGADGGPIEIDDKNKRDIGRRLAFAMAVGLRASQAAKLIEHGQDDDDDG